jgi:hypothetical protein
MPIQYSPFFIRHLQGAFESLLRTETARHFLSGTFRFDGDDFVVGQVVEYIEGQFLQSEEFARLLMIFDGGRVHAQNQLNFGLDDSPPGIYFTSVNRRIIHQGHKNRIGLVRIADDANGLFVESLEEDLPDDEDVAEDVEAEYRQGLHVDHHYLADDAPHFLGTISFALCAMTAHNLGFVSISLIAGGGRGFNLDMIGYRYWPKVGFDAALLEDETAGAAYLADCRTVQDVLARDPAWWERNGSQRLMEFDLSEGSPSWEKLLDYLREKELI